jgi:hypothetical protein
MRSAYLSYLRTDALARFRWQNGGMAHVPSSALRPYTRKKTIALTWKALQKRYPGLRKIYLKRVLPNKQAQKWHAQYVEQTDQTYLASKITHQVTSSTLGKHRGEVVFLFLKDVISPMDRAIARLGLDLMHFSPCNHQSSRPELKNAITYNQHMNPIAGECNPGWGTRGGIKLKLDSLNNKAAIPYLDPLVLTMGDVFQQTLPGILRQQNPHVPAPFRHGLSIFTNLTILQSACSAIHKDTPNGKGFACMTTVQGPGRTYSGGTFCFVDFGVTIAVKPGDLLIANTPDHWHCNIGAVKGVKYSVIGYFKRFLTGKGFITGWRGRNPTLPLFLTKEERDALRADQIEQWIKSPRAQRIKKQIADQSR